jgi:signal transduction histidine kinase
MFANTSSIIDAPPTSDRVSEAEIDLGKCRLLFQNTGIAQAIVSLDAVILVFILGGLHPPLWALTWLATVFVVSGYRYRLSLRFLRSHPTAADAATWRIRAIRWTIVAAILWSGGGIALMVADPETTRLFTALVLAGMVSGAVPILSAVPGAYPAYAVPVMVSIILTAAIDSHGVRDWMLSVVSTLYLTALLRSAHYFHDALDNSLRLAQNMQHMARDVEQARSDAEASSNAKSQFLAMMSHEIRTPLNGILGMAQALLKPELTSPQREDYARTILGSGQMLLMLLNDVLDFSKVEAGKLDLNLGECDLEDVMRDTAALFAESARHKGLSIDAHCAGERSARYWADATRMRQMLANLVNNAIKFTPHGFIRIEGQELARDGEYATLELAVADSGIGIPPEQQAMLFRPFVQVDNSDTRRFGGTGLGLSIVRLLAELMGGSVGVDSVPGKGSRFWFRVRVRILPSVQVPDVREGPPSSAGTPATEPKLAHHVLVVEDNLVNRKVVGAMLAKPGLRIDYVENGKLAVDKVAAADHDFKLVLMDCQMPVMDGYAATRAIRAWEREHDRTPVPIIALTAGAFEEDRERCLAAGMDDFLTKPISLAEFNAMLAKWLDLAHCEPS